MTGNRALLTNFVEKFLGMVRFGNDDFAMIDGYGDVVIGSTTIKNVYYVEEKVKEHLVAEEIDKMVEGTEIEDSVEANNSILNSQNDPNTRLDPRSYKERPKVEKTDVVQLVNVIEEEEESAKDDYEL
ncbi:hypothetical protein Tco_1404550 [Tanacetum coccineum]